MDRRRILDDNNMLALTPTMSQIVNHSIGIREKGGPKRIIYPGPRHQTGTDMRADVARVEIDDGVKCCWINKPLFNKD